MHITRLILPAVTALVLALPARVSAQVLWTEGHGDIGMAYEDEGGGFEVHPHWHIEGGTVDGTPRPDEEFDTADLTLVVPNIPETQAIRNANSSWDPIGVGAGEAFWRLPTNPLAGVPYMGWATEDLAVLDWVGDLTFSLTGLNAPGDISVYYFPDGNLTFLWASSDGITGADFFFQAPGAHQHFNVAFSAPGIYEVEITMSGTHVVDGFQSGSSTFVFNVVPEPSSALLLAAGAGILVMARRQRRS